MPEVLILAAGRGERLRPLTDSTPKSLLQVGDKTLLEHHLERLAAQGFSQVVINLAWLGEQIRAHFADERRRFGLTIRYSEEPEGALETGGGIVHALRQLRSDPFIVINADILCDFNYANLRVPESADMHLVLAPTPLHRRRGDFNLAHGREHGQLLAAEEGCQPTWTYTGVACFRCRAFDGFRHQRFPLLPVIEQAINSGRASGEVHRGLWMDVGSPQRLAQARRQIPEPNGSLNC